jgi:hypothetical protein
LHELKIIEKHKNKETYKNRTLLAYGERPILVELAHVARHCAGAVVLLLCGLLCGVCALLAGVEPTRKEIHK